MFYFYFLIFSPSSTTLLIFPFQKYFPTTMTTTITKKKFNSYFCFDSKQTFNFNFFLNFYVWIIPRLSVWWSGECKTSVQMSASSIIAISSSRKSSKKLVGPVICSSDFTCSSTSSRARSKSSCSSWVGSYGSLCCTKND